ncbi:MAG: flavodoxin domain-containing protein [Balneolaceae bacterium]
MSTHGTTEKIVDRLSTLLGYNTSTIINLKDQDVPDLNDYDTIIIGGSVYAGKIQKKIRNYCESNLDELLEKQLGLFMCYMDTENEVQEFEQSFPNELITHAKAKGYFGGELDFNKMNFVEKFVAKRVIGVSKSVSRINSQAINHFAIQITG